MIADMKNIVRFDIVQQIREQNDRQALKIQLGILYRRKDWRNKYNTSLRMLIICPLLWDICSQMFGDVLIAAVVFISVASIIKLALIMAVSVPVALAF